MMFNVIEFDAEAGGGLALVHKSWITPRKKEVYWPPYKDQKVFTKALKFGEEVDEAKWKLYGIEKTYYETGKLKLGPRYILVYFGNFFQK